MLVLGRNLRMGQMKRRHYPQSNSLIREQLWRILDEP